MIWKLRHGFERAEIIEVTIALESRLSLSNVILMTAILGVGVQMFIDGAICRTENASKSRSPGMSHSPRFGILQVYFQKWANSGIAGTPLHSRSTSWREICTPLALTGHSSSSKTSLDTGLSNESSCSWASPQWPSAGSSLQRGLGNTLGRNGRWLVKFWNARNEGGGEGVEGELLEVVGKR